MTLRNAKCQDFLWGLSFVFTFTVHAAVGTRKWNCLFLTRLCSQLSEDPSYLQYHCQLLVKSHGRDWLQLSTKQQMPTTPRLLTGRAPHWPQKNTTGTHCQVSADLWSPFTPHATPEFCGSAGKSKGQTLDCRIVNQWLFHQLAGWTMESSWRHIFVPLTIIKIWCFGGYDCQGARAQHQCDEQGTLRQAEIHGLRPRGLRKDSLLSKILDTLSYRCVSEIRALLLPLLPSSDLRTVCRGTGKAGIVPHMKQFN